jgi:hypothetical protein
LRDTYPEDDQAFLFADLIRVINDPHPQGDRTLSHEPNSTFSR